MTATVSVLILAVPQMALARSQYPPSEISSYEPFNTVCLDEDIEQALAQLNEDAPEADPETDQQFDTALTALTVCGAEAFPALLGFFEASSTGIQHRIITALVDLGPQVREILPDLAQLLYEADEAIASRLPYAIADIGQAEAVPILIEALQHPSVGIRQGAADGLGLIGPAAQPAVPALKVALQDPQLQDAAASALDDIGPGAAAAIKDLIPLLADESTSDSAVVALGGIGAAAVSDLVEALASPNLTVRVAAADALRRMPPGDAAAAVPALMEALDEKSETLRFYAIDALENIGPPAAAAVPALVDLLEQEYLVVRALASIGEPAVPDLVALLAEPNVQLQSAALEALERIGPEAAAAVPALVALLDQPSTPTSDDSLAIRSTRSTIRALGAIGPAAEPAIPQLIELLADPDDSIRQAAAIALGNIGPAAVPDLITAFFQDNDAVKVLVSIALGEIGPEAELAAPILIRVLATSTNERSPSRTRPLRSPSPAEISRLDLPVRPTQPTLSPSLITPEISADTAVKFSAALALGNIGVPHEAAVPYLITLLHNEEAGIQSAAAYALGNMGSTAQAAVPDLIQVMGMGGLIDIIPVINARASATTALIKIGRPAIPALIETLRDENVIAHTRATDALGQIGADAIPALITTLADDDIHVRRRAAFALGIIGEPAIPALTAALRSPNLAVQKAAAAALGLTEIPDDTSMMALRAIVDQPDQDLDLRRIAASALQQLGGDTEEFFQTYRLPSPQTIACPDIGFEEYEFDVLTGDCLWTYGESYFLAGIGGVLGPLCRLLRC